MPLASSSRQDRPRQVVDAPLRPLEVVAVGVEVRADRLVDRVARVVAEDRARAQAAPRRHVDARDERVAVVLARTGRSPAADSGRSMNRAGRRRWSRPACRRRGCSTGRSSASPARTRTNRSRCRTRSRVWYCSTRWKVALRAAAGISVAGRIELRRGQPDDAAVRARRPFADVDLRASGRGPRLPTKSNAGGQVGHQLALHAHAVATTGSPCAGRRRSAARC